MDTERIEALLTRGVAEMIGDGLKEQLLRGEKLRVKLGIDPTSPDLHLGRAVPLLKLRDFQEQGHQVVLIIGDFTGIIGDTSDKDAERPMLSAEEIERNQKTYFEQAGKIIDLEKAELYRNSEWLTPLTYKEIGEQADLFSVSDFISRENIAKRLKEGKRVSLREVLYPLMQGYDSVAVRADIELGGTDQRFNLLAGRVMQARYGQRPQDVIMTPLINGLDGRKMSSSWGNTITLTMTADDMYGKVMSMKDSEIGIYFEVGTRVFLEEVKEILKLHPKEAKMRLAREIVSLYHGNNAALSAEENFITAFSEGGIPADIKTVRAARGTKLSDIVISEALVPSRTEWRRLISEGAVKSMEEGTVIDSVDAPLETSLTLKIGKRRFITIEIE